jgi:hypothetical protein
LTDRSTLPNPCTRSNVVHMIGLSTWRQPGSSFIFIDIADIYIWIELINHTLLDLTSTKLIKRMNILSQSCWHWRSRGREIDTNWITMVAWGSNRSSKGQGSRREERSQTSGLGSVQFCFVGLSFILPPPRLLGWAKPTYTSQTLESGLENMQGVTL